MVPNVRDHALSDESVDNARARNSSLILEGYYQSEIYFLLFPLDVDIPPIRSLLLQYAGRSVVWSGGNSLPMFEEWLLMKKQRPRAS